MILVSVPYEITLLSNVNPNYGVESRVSVPYEITLLSNLSGTTEYYIIVSVPYEITLLSNLNVVADEYARFQYLMKLHYSQTFIHCFSI